MAGFFVFHPLADFKYFISVLYEKIKLFQYYVLHTTFLYLYLCQRQYYIGLEFEINSFDIQPKRCSIKTKTMKIENTKAQMRKGVLEYCILSILNRNEAYPSEILEFLKAGKLIVVEGTLYPLLTRLKNAGLLSYRWEESKSGPPRKYFKLTDTGKSFLTELDQTWTDLESAVKLTTTKTK